MLRAYRREDCRLVPTELDLTSHSPPADASGALWLDLITPTREEVHFAEHLLGLSIPTQEEAQEIEVSARLYHEDSAEFMTMTGVSQLESEAPMTTPISFILKGETLATIRYAQPKPFFTYATRAQKAGAVPCINSEQVMLGLVEALIERMAEALEKTGRNLERLSRQVFRYKPPGGTASKSRDFQAIIEEIGARGDLLAMVRESLVSLNRLLAYHNTTGKAADGPSKDAVAWVKDMLQDVVALSDHATYLSNKTNFLLDATLGLINLEQNQIIKIFSIAAVCLMPPTLIASSYGMNFRHMPELEWLFGYPYALALMLITAIIPFVWFKRKGWL
ncbi:MAG: magnesium transporter [Alphaproteobacteria bacterium]|jgi:magnesium transporter|nr:magnesium transporter [Alphaproteobacteria bacterium]